MSIEVFIVTDSSNCDSNAQSRLEEILRTVASLATDYLDESADRNTSVRRPVTPADIRSAIETTASASGRPLDDLLQEFEAILSASVRTTHPRFANQLFVGADLAGIVGEWLTALLDTTMATFEMAPVATVLERDLIGRMCDFAGFDNGEGLLTPGGSISNLMAVMAARNRAYPRARTEGMAGKQPPALFASAESHYSISRAANILGLGINAIYPVGVDDTGRMRPNALRNRIDEATSDGRRPFFVCATAGTTVAGAYDPVDAIADICEERDLWFHVDGAYGGAALLSSRHRHLMKGCHRADSITWCPHKMMGLPLVCSALLMRHRGHLKRGLSVDADYSFHDEPRDASPALSDSSDLGEMSLQCGRRIDSIKLWLAWQTRGDDGYEAMVNRYFALAQRFAELIEDRQHFELVRPPHGCNVLFHYIPHHLRDMAPGPERKQRLDAVTRTLRESVKDAGRVMINYGPVDGHATFRMVHINPRMTEDDLPVFLDEIERAARREYKPQPQIADVG